MALRSVCVSCSAGGVCSCVPDSAGAGEGVDDSIGVEEVRQCSQTAQMFKLLIRGNRRITLTEEGMLLRKRAQEIMELVDKTESELGNMNEVINGDIYIGSGETDAMRLIAKVVKKLQEEHPHIQYHLYSGNADDVMERLDNGLLDFGVIIGSASIQKYDYLSLPATDTWGLLMRKDSPLAALDSIGPKNLRDIPLLCSRQALAGNELSGWLRDDSEKLNIVATYNLIYYAALMVEEGIGYALCLDKLVNTTSSAVFVLSHWSHG